MSQVGLEAVWAAGFNFQPDFEAFDVEDVVTFSWEPLYSFMFLEVLETNIATRQPQISISLQIHQGLYFSKVLIVRRQNVLDLWRQLMIMCQYALFILNIIHNSSLHQKDTIFVQSPYKFLSSLYLILNICQGVFKDFQSFLVLQIYLTNNFQNTNANMS